MYSTVEFLHYFPTFVQSLIKISGSTPRARLTGKRHRMWKPYLIFFILSNVMSSYNFNRVISTRKTSGITPFTPGKTA